MLICTMLMLMVMLKMILMMIVAMMIHTMLMLMVMLLSVEDDIGSADLYNADNGTKLHLHVDAQSTFLPHSQPQNQIILDDHDEYGEFDQSL